MSEFLRKKENCHVIINWLWKVAEADNGLAESEKNVINEFAKTYSVLPKVVEITEKWAKALKQIEGDYETAVAELLSL